MSKLLQFELSKVLKNRLFFISLAIITLIVMIDAVFAVSAAQQFETNNDMLYNTLSDGSYDTNIGLGKAEIFV